MHSIPFSDKEVMDFDYLPAITRNLELRLMRRRLSRTQDIQGAWESWLSSQIHASEQEIVEARNEKCPLLRAADIQ